MIWLDCLRLIAGLSMVVLHTTADPNGKPWLDYPTAERIAPIVLRTLAYMARTELFLLIACFLLVVSLQRRPRGYVATIAEQSRRLLLPFVFWTMFFGFYSLIKAQNFGYFDSAWTNLTSPTAWVGNLLLGDVKYHMHFLPTLFGLVLFYPLFLVAYRFPIAGLAILPLLILKWELDRQVWSTFWGTDALPYAVRLVKLMTYVGFGMAAAALAALYHRRTAKELQTWLPHVILLAVLLMMFKAFASHRTLSENAWQHSFFPGYVADFLMPLILFFACMALCTLRWPSLLSRIGGYSFGIYLCHPIFVDLAEIGLKSSSLSPIQQIGIKVIFALTMTPILVVLLSRIPATAWTVGLGPLPSLGSLFEKLVQRSKLNAVNR